jgi:hypothetical protein
MVRWAFIGVVLANAALAGWYCFFLHYNRQRALQVFQWLKGAVTPYGGLGELSCRGSSRFRVWLCFSAADFRRPYLDLHLASRPFPLSWAWWRLQRRQETLTFCADLPVPPSEWVTIGRGRFPLSAARSAHTLDSGRAGENGTQRTVAKIYLSTQPKGLPQLDGPMGVALAHGELDYLAISFRPRSPHLAVTFSLREAMSYPGGELAIFSGLRELASSSRGHGP